MSNFVRNGDVKETLRIGRKANSFPIDHMNVRAEAAIPLLDVELDQKVLARFKFEEGTKRIKMGFGFLLSGAALIKALEMLNEDGISKKFDDYIQGLILTRVPHESRKYDPKIPFDLEPKNIFTKVKYILISSEKFGTFQLTFKSTGRDILYKEELYRIAPPKDGGLDE